MEVLDVVVLLFAGPFVFIKGLVSDIANVGQQRGTQGCETMEENGKKEMEEGCCADGARPGTFLGAGVGSEERHVTDESERAEGG